MSETAEQLCAAIAALDLQRAVLGAAVVDAASAALRDRLAALQPAKKLEQRLRQVSTLFVDVVGSTAIGQRLSPEAISAVMDGALSRYTTIVEAHHGRVLQYTGDGMLAGFGTESSHEDDVESAVCAGLAIIEDTRRHAPDMLARHGVPDFNVRLGIHTGRVLLGAGVDAGGSIRGASVNLAARMEQTAPPGCLRISHETYRHVSGLFDVGEQEPVFVKGVDGPVRGYLVERAKPRAFRVPTRGIDGVATPMVGRDGDFARLLGALDAVRGERCLRVVAIVGEAGLGKSRLVAEFQQSLDRSSQPCWLLLGRAEPRAASRPYRLLYDLLAWQLHIDDGDGAEEARRKFVEGLAPLFDAEGVAPIHVLGHLLGLDFSASPHTEGLRDDEALLRERGFAAAVLMLRRLGAEAARPVIMLLDDVHWADGGSLDFVQHIADLQRDLPVLCVLLTRPPNAEDGSRLCMVDAADVRIDLKPLDRSNSQQLASLLLQRMDDVPPALCALLTGGAEGNPFYMEELLKMLLDDGIIVAEADGWRVLPDRLQAARVPQTLVGVLQARLDALAPAERLALQQAAIVGATFSEAAVSAIDPQALLAVPVLLRKQMLRRAAPVFGGTREYAFGHHLLHQVSYDSVLHEVRVKGHACVGAFWRARAEVASPQQVDPGACRALAEACEHGRVADVADLIHWFEAQFFNYLNAYVGRVLRPLVQAMVDLAEVRHGADDVITARALTNLARVVLQQSDTAVAEPLLRRALAIQQAAFGDDHADTARTYAVLGGYFQGRGDLPAAEPLLRRAFQIRERVLGAEHALTLFVLEVLAHVVTELGRLDEAEALCRRVLEARERQLGPDDPGTASALTTLGEVLTKQGQGAAAELLIRRALQVQQRCLPPEHPDIGLTLWHLAETLRTLGRAAEAEAVARQTLELWEASIGDDHEWTAWGLLSLAELCLQHGDATEAATLSERALGIYERLFGPAHAQVAITLSVLTRALDLSNDPRVETLRLRATLIQDGAAAQPVGV